ncbi:MAG: PKD domain-containing protein [Flavobacteriales bacterium]|nr:PKD domain-containing protein [Flavobacteriales bacterium]
MPTTNQLRRIVALTLLCVGFSMHIHAQCDADAGPNVQTCAGVGVQIGGNPTAVDPNPGPPGVSYSWTPTTGLNDPTIANPIATPSTTTTYTVTLSGNGCNGQTDQVQVTVLPSPNANFNFTPNNTPCADTPIAFTNTTTGCTGCTYEWDFGDGSPISTQQNPTHTFSSAVGTGTQNFTVTLTVTAANGCEDTYVSGILVKRIPDVELTDPISSFTNCSGDPTFSLSVFDAGTTTGNTNYTIDWGDGSSDWTGSSSPQGVNHVYTGNEVFDLVYTVTGPNGCSVSETYYVSNITNPSIGAANPGGTQGCGPLNICFPLNNYAGNHESTTYLVDFGDGSPTQLLNHPPPTEICHTYSGSSCATNPSGYTFSITATNNCDQSVATIFPVKVYSAPVASFTPTPVPACVNSTVTFINNSTAGYNSSCAQTGTYTWNFGDGSPSVTVATLSNQTHVYTTPGTYTVTMTATNACGNSTDTHVVCIEPAPTPIFTVNDNDGCFPMAVTTDNTSLSPNSCSTSTNWYLTYSDLPCDPDDGTYSYTGGTSASSLEPQFSLTSVGIYTIHLEMTNACGTFEDTEVITVNTVPVVDVTTPSSVCVGASGGTPTGVVDGCNLPVTQYTWSFPSGTPASASTLAAPNVTYANPGNYNVTLTAQNSCGTGSDTGVMNVLPAPDVQITASDVDNTICNGQATILTATGAGSYTWSPSTYLSNYSGTGNTVQSNPTGTITYTVTGTSGSCSDTGTITLNIDPLPTVNPGGTFEMCAGQNEQLSLNVTGGSGTYNTYLWSPNQYLTNNAISNPVCNSPSSTSYSVQVTDSHGCIGTGTVPVTVNPLPPTYAGPDINLCNQPVATQLTGFSPTTGGTGPGGSGTWSGPNVTGSGVFTPAGVGCVTLTYCFTYATTGCNACDNIQICVTDPVPANAGPDTTICLSVGSIQLPAGSWTGSPNVSASGVYTPTVPMVDDVIVTQGTGSCATTDTTIVTVLPLPVADAGPDVTICAGESVDLSGVCTSCPNGPAAFCTWTGGPSSPALSCDPSTGPLNSTTTYNLTLVDAESCTDSDQITIFVNPLPPTNAGPDMTLCNQPIATQINGSPAGGTWTGTGITSGGSFTPTGTGSFVMTYCYTNPSTGCEKCDDMTITITNATTADAGPDVELCLNSGNMTLPTTTPGGAWSAPVGTPVTTSGVFTPSTVGSYTITYTLGSGTCLTTDDVEVTVNPLPTLDAGTDITICVNDTASIQAVASGGTAPYDISWNFSGWLSDDQALNTLAFPVNTTTFTGTLTDDNNCTDTDAITVFVNGLPIVEAGNNITVCDQAIEETLTGFSANTTGTGEWFGTGIVDPAGVFMSPGIGTYWLYYEFTAGGNNCTGIDSIQVTVIAPVIANAGPDLTLCLNEGAYTLTGFNPVTNLEWSGPGVIDATNGIINPELAGVGTWDLTIETGTGTCYSSDQMELEVLPLPNVQAGPGAVVCGNAAIFDLTGFVPVTGGTWEGTGIIDASTGTFDPSIGANTYDLIYWYTDPTTQCSDTATTTVNVSPVPVANFNVPVLGCTNSPVAIDNLSTGATQYLWAFGNGDELNGFEPSYTYPAPTQGVFDITMIASNNFGCADTASNSNEIINPPTADLLIDPAMGCAPLQVTFDNQSVGLYTTFNWDLSTSTSTDSIPLPVTYQQGNDVVEYPVSLTVTNFCGVVTDDDVITVMPQPIAGFGTDLNADCSPFEVHFNNTSTGLPDTYEWDFGDGTGGTSMEPGQHVYYADTVNVDYTIWLYVSNECGADTVSHTITVFPNTVTAFFNTSVTEGCEPLTVQFTDFSDGANQISYDLGPVNTGQDNPSYTYSEGTYTIYQYADNGCSYDTAQVTIHVFPSPDIDFEPNVPNICSHNSVEFIADLDGAVDYEWDFGDGNTSYLSQPIHEYENGGNYTVTLTAISDNLCTTTISHPFVVFDGPQASFTIPDQIGCSPFNVCFSNTTTAGNFYSWDFGDGNTANTTNACNEYTNESSDADIYTVSLIVQDMQLCADTFEMNVIVAPQPICAFTLSAEESCYFPQTVSATNMSQFANGYEWYLDGEYYSGLLNTSFIFDEVGTHQIDLTSTNSFNCTSSSTATYTIHPLPEVAFSVAPDAGCVPLTVAFSNESTGATSYTWLFGDGSQSSASNPQYVYSVAGAYDVSLIAITDEGCVDTVTMNDMIHAYRLPVADFYFDPEETDIYSPEVTFFDNSQYAAHWDWDFGDGTSVSQQNVRHTFPDAGIWEVTLEVATNYGCTDTISKIVVVNDIFNVFVPNAFTPDNDDLNEVFLPKLTGIPFIETYKFQIFDRWGTVIFETDDPEMAWTGDVRNGEYYAKDDAYNWLIVVQLKNSDKERVYRGHVILVR